MRNWINGMIFVWNEMDAPLESVVFPRSLWCSDWEAFDFFNIGSHIVGGSSTDRRLSPFSIENDILSQLFGGVYLPIFNELMIVPIFWFDIGRSLIVLRGGYEQYRR
jgi:hypothetical protein